MLQPEEKSNAQRDPPKTTGELGTLQKLERSHLGLGSGGQRVTARFLMRLLAPFTAQLLWFSFGLFCNVFRSSEEIRSFNKRLSWLTAEQDHGRTDAPGRKVHTNVEDTKEVVVAARLMNLAVN